MILAYSQAHDICNFNSFSLLLISHEFLNTKLLDDMGTIFGLKEADWILDKTLQVHFSFWFKRDYFLFLRILIVKV